MPSDIDRLLRRIHAPVIEVPAADPKLERDTIARWSARHGQASRRGWFMRGASLRLAFAFAGLLLVIVGACVLPTSYEVPLGLSVEITSPAELPHAAIVEFVRERGDASEIEVFVRRHEGHGEPAIERSEPQTQMQIHMWDQDLAVGELEHELREAFPEELRDATIVETPLEGELETIWGRRIAHRAFHVALREADIEQAREHLLIQLRAQGLTAEQVVVEVNDRPDGRREIRVEIEREADGEGAPELSLPLDELGHP
jgi:hypothetical protein